MKILRDAFAAMFKDKDFQQEVDKLGWNDELIRGDELNKKVDGLVHNEIGDGLFSKNIAIASFRADPSFWLAQREDFWRVKCGSSLSDLFGRV